MAGPLLETKVRVPRRRRGLVARPRLGERLSRAADSTLTLVSAPAGFGEDDAAGGLAGHAAGAWSLRGVAVRGLRRCSADAPHGQDGEGAEDGADSGDRVQH